MELGEFLTSTTGIALLAVLVSFLAWITGLFQWLWDRGKKPVPLIVQTETIRPGSAGTITLTVEAYEARIQARADEIANQILDATGDERDRLIAAKSDLERRLADIDTAYAEAKAKITELEKTLARFGNEIGGDRLAEARTALEAGDFSKADEIFAEVQAREEIAVQRAADAAFGQGQIAEEQVRWADAAEHYAKAARLAADYDRLIAAGNMLWRAGRSNEAIRFEEDAVSLAKREFGEPDPKTATALNNLAGSYRAMGRYEDAEPLLRQALAIDAKTIGTSHPGFAIDLNNLAGLLKQMGRIEEARPLLDEAVAIWRRSLGEDHPDYAAGLWWKADFASAGGDWDAARSDYSAAYAVYFRVMGEDHPDTKNLSGHYAGLLLAQFPDDPALAELESAFGPDIGR